MKIKSILIPVIIFVIVFGGIKTADMLGYWSTESSKVPARYKAPELSNKYNPEDIRGSYAFSDIVQYFEIPLEDLMEAFELNKEEAANFKCKEIKNKYEVLKNEGKEIGTASVKYFVALYKGLPYELNEEIYLPSSAVKILKEKVKLTDEQVEYLESHKVFLSNTKKDDSILETSEGNTNMKYEDGKFQGTAKGYRNGINVEVTINNDKISAIEILSHRETQDYYEEPMQIIPQGIINTQSLDVDVISGATMTSKGIINAVNNALEKAKIRP